MPDQEPPSSPDASPRANDVSAIDANGRDEPGVVPERFQVARGTLRFDKFMTHAIKIGGLGIIVAVFGIFVFIFSQVLPLFQRASIEELGQWSLSDKAPLVLGIDEWSELPFSYFGDDQLHFTDLPGDRGTFSETIALPENAAVTAVDYDSAHHRLVLGTADGRAGIVSISYQPSFDEQSKRTITAEIDAGEFLEAGENGVPIRLIGYGDSGTAKMIALVQDLDGESQLRVVTLKQKRTLLGAGKIEVDRSFDLSDQVEGHLDRLLVSRRADAIIAANDQGEIFYLFRRGDKMALRQRFTPFEDLDEARLGGMNFILGDNSIIVSNKDGEQRTFSLYIPEGQNTRLFGKTKSFPKLPGADPVFVASERNKAFFVGVGHTASLRYNTTAAVRWQRELPFEVAGAAIDGKFEHVALVDHEGTLHLYELDDPHPEAGWRAFFGKIWYKDTRADLCLAIHRRQRLL